jgi:hypothetical protein
VNSQAIITVDYASRVKNHQVFCRERTSTWLARKREFQNRTCFTDVKMCVTYIVRPIRTLLIRTVRQDVLLCMALPYNSLTSSQLSM